MRAGKGHSQTAISPDDEELNPLCHTHQPSSANPAAPPVRGLSRVISRAGRVEWRLWNKFAEQSTHSLVVTLSLKITQSLEMQNCSLPKDHF